MYGRSSKLRLYQTYTSALLFDTLVTGTLELGKTCGAPAKSQDHRNVKLQHHVTLAAATLIHFDRERLALTHLEPSLELLQQLVSSSISTAAQSVEQCIFTFLQLPHLFLFDTWRERLWL